MMTPSREKVEEEGVLQNAAQCHTRAKHGDNPKAQCRQWGFLNELHKINRATKMD
jgi:hypothetical protein